MLLGCLLAGLSVLGAYKSYTALALLVPLAALGVPVLDTALAITRRWRTRRPIFQADTEHLHHRLLRRGPGPPPTPGGVPPAARLPRLPPPAGGARSRVPLA